MRLRYFFSFILFKHTQLRCQAGKGEAPLLCWSLSILMREIDSPHRCWEYVWTSQQEIRPFAFSAFLFSLDNDPYLFRTVQRDLSLETSIPHLLKQESFYPLEFRPKNPLIRPLSATLVLLSCATFPLFDGFVIRFAPSFPLSQAKLMEACR